VKSGRIRHNPNNNLVGAKIMEQFNSSYFISLFSDLDYNNGQDKQYFFYIHFFMLALILFGFNQLNHGAFYALKHYNKYFQAPTKMLRLGLT